VEVLEAVDGPLLVVGLGLPEPALLNLVEYLAKSIGV